MNNYGKVELRLDRIIKQKNMSKNKLSELTGISFTGIQSYYNCTSKRIDLDILARFCKALDCNVEDLMEYQE